MPFREEILELYPRAIQELTRRNVDVNYIATQDKFLLRNKQGSEKIIDESELIEIESRLSKKGNLQVIEQNYSDILL